MNNLKWLVSIDGDFWTVDEEFETKGKAIAYGKRKYENYDIQEFTVGQNKFVELSEICVDEERVIENIAEMMHDVYGEVAEDYLQDVTVEHSNILQKRLSKVFIGWAKEFGYEPNFYEIINVDVIGLE